MPTDDELIATLRAAVDEETADLHYRGPVPAVRTRSLARPLGAVAAAAAVAAIAVVGAQLTPGDDGSTPSTEGPSPTATGGEGWVANSGPALADLLADPGRVRPEDPDRGSGPTPGDPSIDLCLLPADDTAATCGGSPRAPYPMLLDLDAVVPASAERFPELDGLEGEVVRGWVGADPTYGGLVWLRYADDRTVRISAAHYRSGEELARYLLRHPAGT